MFEEENFPSLKSIASRTFVARINKPLPAELFNLGAFCDLLLLFCLRLGERD